MIPQKCIKWLAVARDFLGLGKERKKRKVGRPLVYKDTQLQFAEVAMRMFGIPSEKRLVKEMRRNPEIRKFCKLRKVPSSSTLSRRRQRIGVDAKSLFYGMVRKLKELLKWFSNKFSVDSKLFWAHSNRHKKTDTDAEWGYCAAKEMLIFGYKVHIVTEVLTELPVAFIITPANASDNLPFFVLFRELGKNFSYEIKKIIADCGYDDSDIRKLLRERSIGVCIARNGRGHYASEKPKDADYGHRTASERVNSRMDLLFGLPDLKLHGLENVVYHVSMVLSAILFVAISSKLTGGEISRSFGQLEEKAFKERV